MYTKYDMALILARVHQPALEVGDNLVRVDEGPKPGETVRPKDCHLSNVRHPHFYPVWNALELTGHGYLYSAPWRCSTSTRAQSTLRPGGGRTFRSRVPGTRCASP